MAYTNPFFPSSTRNTVYHGIQKNELMTTLITCAILIADKDKNPVDAAFGAMAAVRAITREI